MNLNSRKLSTLSARTRRDVIASIHEASVTYWKRCDDTSNRVRFLNVAPKRDSRGTTRRVYSSLITLPPWKCMLMVAPTASTDPTLSAHAMNDWASAGFLTCTVDRAHSVVLPHHHLQCVTAATTAALHVHRRASLRHGRW